MEKTEEESYSFKIDPRDNTNKTTTHNLNSQDRTNISNFKRKSLSYSIFAVGRAKLKAAIGPKFLVSP